MCRHGPSHGDLADSECAAASHGACAPGPNRPPFTTSFCAHSPGILALAASGVHTGCAPSRHKSGGPRRVAPGARGTRTTSESGVGLIDNATTRLGIGLCLTAALSMSKGGAASAEALGTEFADGHTHNLKRLALSRRTRPTSKLVQAGASGRGRRTDHGPGAACGRWNHTVSIGRLSLIWTNSKLICVELAQRRA